jgi:hypothetical protein
VLALSLLGVLVCWQAARAQPMLQQVATDLEVSVAVPEGLRPTPGLSAWPDAAPEVVGLATFTDGAEEPLNIQIRRGELHGWESLPAANAEVAAEWARRFEAGLQLPEAYDFTPGAYDPLRSTPEPEERFYYGKDHRERRRTGQRGSRDLGRTGPQLGLRS